MKADVLETVREPLKALEDQFTANNPGVKIQRVPAAKAKKGF